ncbi:MAG: hypothetical protein QNJ90_00590 [Planctomycetota bacterium]|nr:hypothetical protein [Planctomycetota bacterium]
MRRGLFLGGGVVLLAVAVLLRVPPPAEPATAALGRSMGGLRVMVINGLFLRAESRRRDGRVEEAAGLYRTVLELDPANEAAAGFLAATYVQELLPQIPDLRERFGWWQEARGLLAAALERRPDAPGLHARMANLVLDAPLADPGFAALLREEIPQPGRHALRHLRTAFRGAGTLPRLGRDHLVRAALLAPDVAARGLLLEDEEARTEAVAIGREALTLRRGLLSEIRLDDGTDLAAVLTAGLDAVEAVAAAGPDPASRAAAGRAVGAYDKLVPRSRVVQTLRAVLQRRGG